MKYYLIVGEASGDLHASNLMKALQERDHQAEFRYYGGDKMETVGGTLVKHYRELAYMGFLPVLLHLPTILSNMRACKQDIVSWGPDVVILVDYPGFNLNIAKFLRSHTSIPIYYYIAPKIWAWKEYRIKNIRRDVDELFSILPFEVAFFEQKHHYPIHYVGNPCVDAIEQFRKQHQEQPAANIPTIAILAGSRKQEIKDNLPMMLRVAALQQGYRLVICGAPNIDKSFYDSIMHNTPKADIVYGKTYEVLSQSTAALVTSGTATLETGILRVPQVVCYHLPMSKVYALLRKLLLKVKYVSLVNLVANREIVRELIADQMTEDRLEKELQAILPGGSKRVQMLHDYEEMNRILGPAGASQRAAEAMLEKLEGDKIR